MRGNLLSANIGAAMAAASQQSALATREKYCCDHGFATSPLGLFGLGGLGRYINPRSELEKDFQEYMKDWDK